MEPEITKLRNLVIPPYDDLIGRPFHVEHFNCWHLVEELHHRMGITLPDYRTDREALYDQLDDPESGCIVLFRVEGELTHVGFVVEDECFLHVMEGQSVVKQRLSDPRWSSRIAGYYRWRGLRNSESECLKSRPSM